MIALISCKTDWLFETFRLDPTQIKLLNKHKASSKSV